MVLVKVHYIYIQLNITSTIIHKSIDTSKANDK